MQLENLDTLPQEVRKLYEPYGQKICDILADQIVCLSLYGSAASGNFIEGVSDINSLVVVRDCQLDVFKKCLKLVSKGIKKRITAPLFLTERYILASLDVFPIEFLDMKENHLCLYGRDILSEVVINDEHLRLLCEQQIKGKLIRIRQGYLEVGLKRKGIEALLKESLNSLVPVFRNLIRLKGIQPPTDKEAILVDASKLFELESEVFISIYRDTANDEKINNQDIDVYYARYINQLDILSEAIDQL